MKKTLSFALVFIVFLSAVLLAACNETPPTGDYVRIHIRANSDSPRDQQIKLEVRDNIVAYLTVLLEDCQTAAEAKKTIGKHIGNICGVADGVLAGVCDYRSRVKLCKEEFAENNYGDLTLKKGIYDAIVIELGSGMGANWWCVAFPPLCFVAQENIEYKSKIMEIIQNYKDNKNG